MKKITHMAILAGGVFLLLSAVSACTAPQKEEAAVTDAVAASKQSTAVLTVEAPSETPSQSPDLQTP